MPLATAATATADSTTPSESALAWVQRPRPGIRDGLDEFGGDVRHERQRRRAVAEGFVDADRHRDEKHLHLAARLDVPRRRPLQGALQSDAEQGFAEHLHLDAGGDPDTEVEPGQPLDERVEAEPAVDPAVGHLGVQLGLRAELHTGGGNGEVRLVADLAEPEPHGHADPLQRRHAGGRTDVGVETTGRQHECRIGAAADEDEQVTGQGQADDVGAGEAGDDPQLRYAEVGDRREGRLDVDQCDVGCRQVDDQSADESSP